MALIDDAKQALRITASQFDSEVQDLIDAAKADLQLSGVHPERIVETDPLIRRAVFTYCKANFGYDNPDVDRFRQSYEAMKAHLTLSVDYTTAPA